ncbi:amidohydrolase family protein [Marinicella sp. W31]|uniref:amidohydrolase family protein n=1 Tax=Marinicella sp. W31 TaxID=3023713 RepID=UPI003756ECAC
MKTTILFLCLVAPSVFAAKTVTYDWLTLGKKSGQQVVTHHDDGRIVIDFEFNDRGRGPATQETIRLNETGVMTEYSVTGNSYMGAEVAEKFSLSDGNANWQSSEESGSKNVTEHTPYLPSNASPATQALLIQSLMKQTDKRLPLLPSGEAVAEVLLTAAVSHKDQKKNLKLVALSGLGFTPQYTWLDEQDQLFAVAYGWMGMTPAGWGDVLDDLQKMQDKADEEFHYGLGQKLTGKLPGSTLIHNVNWVDVKKGRLNENSAVLINNGVITAIGKKALRFKAEKSIDAQGKTLIPGLWDMHTHISISDGLLQIAAGVTSARDLANKHDDLMQTISAFDSGRAIGPHIYKAGFIDQKSPFSAPTGQLAETLEEALNYVDWYAERGYPQIKIYSSITPAWVKPIAERIHKNGMKLSGHIPSFMTTEQAVKDGFDEIQHINMIFLNFLAGPEDDTRTPVRFTLVGEKAGSLDLASKQVEQFIQLLKKSKTIVDPTVTIFHSMFLNKAGEIDPNYAMIADHLPANVRRGFLSSTMDINAENEAQYKASAQALLAMIKKLHDAGIPLVAGTDAIAGFTLHRELELYNQAGISPQDVLRIATLDSARVVGKDKTNGSIEVGKAADLVLLDGNPLENISAVRNVVWTIKDNHYYDAAQLYQAVGIKPFNEAK